MTDTRATQNGGPTAQLGARARTILKALSENAPARLAAARGPDPVRGEDRRPPAGAAPTLAANDAPQQARPIRAAAVAPAPAEPNKIVPLPRRKRPGAPGVTDAPGAPRQAPRPAAAKAKKSLLKISALLAIGLPTALATIYYGLIASPQYVAEARFAVRGSEDPSGQTNGIGQMMGLTTSITAIASDSFIVAQYVESRHLVDKLQKSVDLRGAYTRDGADFLARYRPYDGDDTAEHLTNYWNSVAKVYFEPISGIITFSVRAFTREDALRIAREAVHESEKLVNDLSERARNDALMDAKQEVARNEIRLKAARKAIQDYRDREGSTDPGTVATSQQTIIADLESQLAKQEAELASSTTFLSRDAPTVRVMRNRIDALKGQIDAQRAKVGSLQAQAAAGKGRPLISSSLTEYENLETDKEFAEKAYQAALTSLENARQRSERQSRYLATFVDPQLPEDSLYPLRLQSILLVLLCASIAWAIGVLIFYGIRDHSA